MNTKKTLKKAVLTKPMLTAVSFAKWISEEFVVHELYSNAWSHRYDKHNYKTTEQLYELYEMFMQKKTWKDILKRYKEMKRRIVSGEASPIEQAK